MNALHLQRVGDELDLWRATGHRPVVWIRDDDACGVTERLIRLATIAVRYDVTVGLALIPGLLEGDLAGYVAARASRFFPMCHGWKHTNHGGPREPAEFGETRPLAASCADAARALNVFRAHFSSGAVFVPPFGRIATAVIRALRGLGFLALSGAQRTVERRCARLISAIGWAPAVNIANAGPLPRIDAHLDLIDWKAGTAADAEVVGANMVAQLRLRRRGLLPAGTPIGLLSHHRVHDERTWELLEGLIEMLTRREVVFADVGNMFQRSEWAAAADRLTH